MNRFAFTGTILCLMVLSGCKKTETSALPDMGYDYFPLFVGRWVEYEVDSVHILGSLTDTSHWHLREEVVSAEKNTSGEEIYLIRRMVRQADTASWVQLPVHATAKCSQREAIYTEGNYTTVKLCFPVKEGLVWDGNAYNASDLQEYRYVFYDQVYTVDGQQFTRTLQVLQQDLTTLISKDYSEECYARAAGLIYAKSVHIENLQSGEYKSGWISESRFKSQGSSL